MVVLYVEVKENVLFDCEWYCFDNYKYVWLFVDEMEEYERNVEFIKNCEEYGWIKIMRERYVVDGSGKLGGCRSNRGYDSVVEGMSWVWWIVVLL